MNKEGAVLAARILTELNEISKVVYRIEQGCKKGKERKNDLFISPRFNDLVLTHTKWFYNLYYAIIPVA